jgi:hypothetical protein
MSFRGVCACLLVLLPCVVSAQEKPGIVAALEVRGAPGAQGPELKRLMESKIRAEWDAFKTKDKKAYSDLLADDFVALEDDGQGTRNKYTAASEIDRSVVTNYLLTAVNVTALGSDAAFITYEITMEFPRTAQVRLKRVYVSELWTRDRGQWKARHYQETRVR